MKKPPLGGGVCWVGEALMRKEVCGMETKISMAEKVAEKCMEKVLLILDGDHVPDQDAIRTVSDLVRIANEAKLTQRSIAFFPG